MTREEAIFILKRDNPNNIAIRSGFESLYDQRKEAFSMAIKALEQESNKSEIPTGSNTKKCTTCAYRKIDGKPHEMCKSCVCGNRYKQEPRKGHWELVQRGKCIDICCSNCKATRIKEYAYNYTIDRLDKEDAKECLESDDMRYCPYCGSDNREVEE